jgi:uncharacterized protein (DUF58 family)
MLVLLGILTREIAFASVGIGTLLALSVLGFIFHRRLGILQKHLHVVQRLSRTRVPLGDSVDGELTIRNGSPFTAQILSAQPVVDKALSFRPQTSFNQLLRSGSRSSSKFTITALAKGRFQISGFMLTFTDARGLFTGEVRCGQADWFEVSLGMGAPIPMSPMRLYGGSPEILRRVPRGTEYAGIREYVPGDEYHRVEWKATARLRTLMVKEFHPETRATLQILIDTGRTMHQESYVANRLDEALAVAQLLTESVVGSGNRVGIWVYNETEIVKAMKPAMAEEQLVNLRDLALTVGGQTINEEPATRVPLPRASWPGTLSLPHGEGVARFLRLLKLKLGSGYRKTGVFKALAEATKIGLGLTVIVLTDLQTNNYGLSKAVSTYRRQGDQMIVAQIGASWRLRGGLEEAYTEFERNSRTLKSLRQLGLPVFDLRPDRIATVLVA